ncbi:unnamed protein product [Peniophora sp. CBMAI 1063]|nr:unnamed protein product [Peniophora sp. CBMAI 1063]
MFNLLSLVVAVVAVSGTVLPRAAQIVTKVGVTQTGGYATYYNQFGGYGACGQKNPDSAIIVALQSQRYDASLCGHSVSITNTKTKKTITARIEDNCPGCANDNSLDLSIGAWEAIGQSTSDGSEVPITWKLLN